jgi:hypothetical protein
MMFVVGFNYAYDESVLEAVKGGDAKVASTFVVYEADESYCSITAVVPAD